MSLALRMAVIVCTVVSWAACARAQVKKQDADLTAPDGVKLKVTYFSAAKPGPGVLLMHQCNRDRMSWDGLATQMAQAGIHVVALDYRGYGESGGERFLTMAPEKQTTEVLKWPADIELAYQYLQRQSGVDKTRMGAGGASCGVNNAIHVAHDHPEVKTLVLLSGPVDDVSIQFVEANPRIPILSAASDEDGDMLPTMRWLMGFARNPQNKLLAYNNAAHGTEMFKVEKNLQPIILEWYKTTLWQEPRVENAKSVPKPTAIMEFWDTLMKPGGTARATKMVLDAKKKDPNVFLFPESSINLLGYQLMQEGKTKEAIEVLKMNELAYPRSANVYDSLGDAYFADHQNDLALQYSEKALKTLAEYPKENPGNNQGIHDSAEGKIHKLKPQ
jgi:alpha-beta hydrolase superfamily lysophospholipase